MGYQQRAKPPRNSGRHGMPRSRKIKAKGQKVRSNGGLPLDQNSSPTSEEIIEKTRSRLFILGNQKFVVYPFSEYFSNWLATLRAVLSELDLRSAVKPDDKFKRECSEILSSVEGKLEERRRKETSHEECVKRLSEDRILLGRIEEAYTARLQDIERRSDSEINRLSINIGSIQKELEHINRVKKGIFGFISKKARAEEEAEASSKLNAAQTTLTHAVQQFTHEQERLRDDYDSRKQEVIEQVENHQKEVENEEVDSSFEARRSACEDLTNAVNALLQKTS